MPKQKKKANVRQLVSPDNLINPGTTNAQTFASIGASHQKQSHGKNGLAKLSPNNQANTTKPLTRQKTNASKNTNIRAQAKVNTAIGTTACAKKVSAKNACAKKVSAKKACAKKVSAKKVKGKKVSAKKACAKKASYVKANGKKGTVKQSSRIPSRQQQNIINQGFSEACKFGTVQEETQHQCQQQKQTNQDEEEKDWITIQQCVDNGNYQQLTYWPSDTPQEQVESLKKLSFDDLRKQFNYPQANFIELFSDKTPEESKQGKVFGLQHALCHTHQRNWVHTLQKASGPALMKDGWEEVIKWIRQRTDITQTKKSKKASQDLKECEHLKIDRYYPQSNEMVFVVNTFPVFKKPLSKIFEQDIPQEDVLRNTTKVDSKLTPVEYQVFKQKNYKSYEFFKLPWFEQLEKQFVNYFAMLPKSQLPKSLLQPNSKDLLTVCVYYNGSFMRLTVNLLPEMNTSPYPMLMSRLLQQVQDIQIDKDNGDYFGKLIVDGAQYQRKYCLAKLMQGKKFRTAYFEPNIHSRRCKMRNIAKSYMRPSSSLHKAILKGKHLQRYYVWDTKKDNFRCAKWFQRLVISIFTHVGVAGKDLKPGMMPHIELYADTIGQNVVFGPGHYSPAQAFHHRLALAIAGLHVVVNAPWLLLEEAVQEMSKVKACYPKTRVAFIGGLTPQNIEWCVQAMLNPAFKFECFIDQNRSGVFATPTKKVQEGDNLTLKDIAEECPSSIHIIAVFSMLSSCNPGGVHGNIKKALSELLKIQGERSKLDLQLCKVIEERNKTIKFLKDNCTCQRKAPSQKKTAIPDKKKLHFVQQQNKIGLQQANALADLFKNLQQKHDQKVSKDVEKYLQKPQFAEVLNTIDGLKEAEDIDTEYFEIFHDRREEECKFKDMEEWELWNQQISPRSDSLGSECLSVEIETEQNVLVEQEKIEGQANQAKQAEQHFVEEFSVQLGQSRLAFQKHLFAKNEVQNIENLQVQKRKFDEFLLSIGEDYALQIEDQQSKKRLCLLNTASNKFLGVEQNCNNEQETKFLIPQLQNYIQNREAELNMQSSLQKKTPVYNQQAQDTNIFFKNNTSAVYSGHSKDYSKEASANDMKTIEKQNLGISPTGCQSMGTNLNLSPYTPLIQLDKSLNRKTQNPYSEQELAFNQESVLKKNDVFVPEYLLPQAITERIATAKKYIQTHGLEKKICDKCFCKLEEAENIEGHQQLCFEFCQSCFAPQLYQYCAVKTCPGKASRFKVCRWCPMLFIYDKEWQAHIDQQRNECCYLYALSAADIGEECTDNAKTENSKGIALRDECDLLCKTAQQNLNKPIGTD